MILLGIFLCLVAGLRAQLTPVVETIYGSVQGITRQTDTGEEYEEYLGIPYATPPIGDLRWRKTVEPEPWHDILNATEYGATCIHFTSDNYLTDWGISNVTSEDCLFLNILVPGTQRQGAELAVMVYVHGGGFYAGSGSIYPFEDLALHGDVILVTFNYRLGTLGFLSTEDDACPGNFGLWDSLAALQWVNDNIAAFGGDVNRITLFGYSAGASITSHLAVSPYSEGLMQRGAALSGQASGFYGIALEGSPSKSAETLAISLGCYERNDTYAMIECLRGLDAEEVDFWGLVGAAVIRRQLPNMIPVIDGDLVPQHPELSWQQGAGSSIDFLTGRSEHDAQSYITANGDGSPVNPVNVANSSESLDLYFSLATAHYPQGDAGVPAIFAQYPGMEADDLDTRTREAVRCTTDWFFDAYRHVEALAHTTTKDEGKKTYCYNFKYRQSFQQYPLEWVTGSHADEHYSYMGYNYKKFFREELGTDFNEDDFFVSDLEMTYYTNFANTGDPNQGREVTVEWPEYTETTKEYMEISRNPAARSETDADLDTYNFWSVEFPRLVNPEDDENQYEDPRENPFAMYELEDLDEEDVYASVEAMRDHMHETTPMTWEEHDTLDERIDLYIERRRERFLANGGYV